MDAFFESSTSLVVLIFFIMSIGTASMLYKFLHKAVPGKVLVRTGLGGMLASFDSMIVLPVLHRLEVMDITQKIIKVERVGSDVVVDYLEQRASE
ncbi:MAG: hypothetical protein GY757_43510 [bacterium]|nr:hypothetical protein [bacterium]